MLQVVDAEVELAGAFRCRQHGAADEGGIGSSSKRLEERLRQEVLVEVEGRHDPSRPSATSSTSGSSVGQRIAGADERSDVADEAVRRRRPGTELLTSELARLRRDEQLDRDDPPAEPDLVGEAARSERRHRRPVLDPLGLSGRDELERHGLGEQACLSGDRLRGDAELAQGALREAGALTEALRQPRQRGLEELERALGGARERLRDHQAREIEGGRERGGLEVTDRDESLARRRPRAGSTGARSARARPAGRHSRGRRGRRRAAAAVSGS